MRGDCNVVCCMESNFRMEMLLDVFLITVSLFLVCYGGSAMLMLGID